MKKVNLDVYKCSFCNRISSKAIGMSNHEKHCKKNPKNIVLCYSCIFYEITVKTLQD